MEANNKHNILLAGIFLVMLFIIDLVSSGNFGLAVDLIGLEWANQEHSDTLNKIMYLISKSATVAILLVTIFFTIFFYLRKRWWDLGFYLFTLIGGGVFNIILKLIIRRPRPEGQQFYDIILFQVESFSFPSGHTMRATVLILLIIYFAFALLKDMNHKIICTTFSISYILIMAMSRVFLKKHFVTDVFGAFFGGLAWVFLCVFIYNWLRNKNIAK